MNLRIISIVVLAVIYLRPARADAGDTATLPGSGFGGDRYATLWTKSPFAIATPEAAAESQDYQLVGLAQFDGVSYASLVDKQTQEHFVLASDKPVRNLTLVSIAHTADGGSAVLQRNGEMLTLKQEGEPAAAPGQPPPNAPPGVPMPTFPQMNPSVGGMPRNYFMHPRVGIHRPPITLPSRPPPQ